MSKYTKNFQHLIGIDMVDKKLALPSELRNHID